MWLLALPLAFTACKKEKVEKVAPSITNFEVGENDNKIGYRGGEVHLEGNINAPETVEKVLLSIRPKSGGTWQLEQDQSKKYAGVKNDDYHEHVDIPAATSLGTYEITLTVVDKVGATAIYTSPLEVKEGSIVIQH